MNRLKYAVLCLLSNAALVQGMDTMLVETTDEFISRTKILPCSRQYTNTLSHCFIEPLGASVGYYVACPVNKNQAILRPAENERKAQLVILTGQLDVYARHFLGYKNYLAVALAAQRNLFATIHETPKCEVLKIRRIDTKKTLKKISIPTYFEIASTFSSNAALAFNKPGTEVIVWGVDVIRNDGESYRGKPHGAPACHYLIYNFEEELESEKVRQSKR